MYLADMSSPERSWGMGLFAAAMSGAVLCFSGFFFGVFPPSGGLFHGAIVPYAGLFFSVLSFAVGHLSYPRVQNLKVTLLGYLTGIIGVSYFLITFNPVSGIVRPADPSVFMLLKWLVLINLILILLVPPFVKYRLTRTITIFLSALETIFVCRLAFPSFFTMPQSWLSGAFPADPVLWLCVLAAGCIVFLSLQPSNHTFHLGGLCSGVAVLVVAPILARHVLIQSRDYERLLIATVPVFVEAGIVLHWFSRMEHRVSYDPLLQVYNRHYCSTIIAEQSNVNCHPPFSVAMIDIDHFKKVNDTHGHQAGDAVLYSVAQAICKEVVPEGTVCRYGGEEVVVFFPRMGLERAAAVVEKVRITVAHMKTKVGRKNLRVTVSAGLSERTDTGQSVAEVIHAADKALYRAKKAGRNQVRTSKTPVPQRSRTQKILSVVS